MFSSASAVRREPDGRYTAELPASWVQGPGIYGGLSGAALLRVLQAEVPDRPPRSITLQYCAPVVPGPATIEVRIERAATSTAYASARLVQDGRVQVHAIALFGQDRPADLDEDRVRPPDVPGPEGVPGVPEGVPGIPTFLGHFDLRFAYGAPPFAGASTSVAGGWVRPRAPEPVDAPLALGLLDVLPPAVLVRTNAPRPLATMVLSATFLDRLPRPELDPAAHLWVDVHSGVTRAGFSDEEVRLFDPGGRLLAVARQLFAVIR